MVQHKDNQPATGQPAHQPCVRRPGRAVARREDHHRPRLRAGRQRRLGHRMCVDLPIAAQQEGRQAADGVGHAADAVDIGQAAGRRAGGCGIPHLGDHAAAVGRVLRVGLVTGIICPAVDVRAHRPGAVRWWQRRHGRQHPDSGTQGGHAGQAKATCPAQHTACAQRRQGTECQQRDSGQALPRNAPQRPLQCRQHKPHSGTGHAQARLPGGRQQAPEREGQHQSQEC